METESDLDFSRAMKVLQFECPVCENPTMADVAKMDSLPVLMDRVEKEIVLAVWEANGRNGAATARDLGIEFHAFRYLLKKHDLSSEKVSHLNCTHD